MNKGFTLLEIAIVITIIALIIGGVFTGQSLIKAAQIRSLATDAEVYSKAVQSFKTKYSGFPGDITNATVFWGRADGGTPATANCAAPDTDTSTNLKLTCNGNGDGHMSIWADRDFNGVGESYDPYERFRTWQQLVDAGMVEGEFTGVNGPNGNLHAIPGKNVPAARMPGVGYTLFYVENKPSNANTFGGWINRHQYQVGRESTTNGSTTVVFMSVADTYALDSKIDDGLPGQGKMVSNVSNCATSNVAATATYLTTTSATPACNFSFDAE